MKTSNLLKLIQDNPDAELVTRAYKKGMSENCTCEVHQLLKLSDIPYEVICNFPYLSSEYFYDWNSLFKEMDECKLRKTEDPVRYKEIIRPYWKNYIIIYC